MDSLPRERDWRPLSHSGMKPAASCRTLRRRRRRRQRRATDLACASEACGRHAGRLRSSPCWGDAAAWTHRAEFDGEESGMPDPLRAATGTLEPLPRLDALLPPEMAKRAEDIGVKKASMALAVLEIPIVGDAGIGQGLDGVHVCAEY